ncbi:MAG: hypothetical protein OXG37_07925 [Actinomycetia bacterium]|nr:hypothetical protein [Actinomycetes bacterium]
MTHEDPLVSVKLPEWRLLRPVELAKLVIACHQLEDGQEITTEVIARLDASGGDMEEAAKRVRRLARGAVGYRDVKKDHGTPHRYDAKAANEICAASGFPLRFNVVTGQAPGEA